MSPLPPRRHEARPGTGGRRLRRALLGSLALGALAVGGWRVAAVVGSDDGAPLAARPATATPAAEVPTPTPTPEPVQFTIVTAGDVLPHATVNRNAALGNGGYDYAPLMEPVRPFIENADLALCSLEVPLAPPGTEVSAYPVFGAPEELITSLRAVGWDGCATATNHSLDRRVAGLEYTLDVMDQAGMGHTGTGRTPEETVSPQFYELTRDGVTLTVAHLSATTFHNDYTDPAKYAASLHPLDAAEITESARQARAAGAAIVILTPHWGQEYWQEPDGLQQETAAAIAAGGQVDIILGGHPHVPQPFARLDGGPDGDGMWVGYSMGNFLSNQDEKCCEISAATGLLVTTTVTVDGGGARVTGLSWSGATIDTAGRQRLHPIQALLDGATTPDLTLTAARVQARWSDLTAVVGTELYNPVPPSGGATVRVVPRG